MCSKIKMFCYAIVDFSLTIYQVLYETRNCSIHTNTIMLHCYFFSLQIIPNKFLNQFGGKISRTVELESPKGNVYVVKVSKHMNKTVLQCGWEAFVDAHHIEENDSLLFRHIENSRFAVLILDSDGCEKVFSCSGKRRASGVQERNADPIDVSSSTHDDTAQSSGGERFARSESGSETAKLAATCSSGGSVLNCWFSSLWTFFVLCFSYTFLY